MPLGQVWSGPLPQSRIIQGVSHRGIVLAGFLAVAMMLGGGGSPSPVAELIVQLAFAAALLLWIWLGEQRDGSGVRPPRSLIALGVALVALPALQLVPLPPSIWQALPSRSFEEAMLALIGQSESWRPLTISPPLTMASIFALIPAIGGMWAAAVLPFRDRRLVLMVIGVIALLGALLGALQMAGGPDAFRLYDKAHRGWLTAFHANRNAAANVLLIGSLALSAWFAQGRDHSWRPKIWPFAAAQMVLLVATVLTGSRAGIALILVSLPFHWLMLRPAQPSTRKRPILVAMASFAIALIALPLVLAGNPRLARVADRFDATSDARIPLWEDSVTAMQAFWPAGSGIGTFPNAFQPFEQVRHLDQFFPNRAHNDYLEFLLEAGLLAIPILIGGAFVLIRLARRAWKLSPREHASHLFALATLTIVALHSIVDYPLRNMAIACLAGVAAGLLTSAPRSIGRRADEEGREDTR